jgi:hypothetical protein
MTTTKFWFDDEDDRPLSAALAGFATVSTVADGGLSSAPSSRSSRGGGY